MEETILAIRDMKVRGAPAIGVAAAYAMAISGDPERGAELLRAARPTAVDLAHAVDFMLSMLRNGMMGFQAAADSPVEPGRFPRLALDLG